MLKRIRNGVGLVLVGLLVGLLVSQKVGIQIQRTGTAISGINLANATDSPITLNASGSGDFGTGALSIGTIASPASSSTGPSQRAIALIVDGKGVAGGATQGFVSANRSTATNAKHFGLEVGNDATGHEITVAITSTNYAGVPFGITGGPSGEVAAIGAYNQVCLTAGTTGLLCENNSGNFIGTTNTTTATGTVTGCTTATTTTIRYTKIGNMVIGSIDKLSCTNNASSVTLTGAVPAGYQPVRQQRCWASGSNNGVGTSLELQFNSASSTITIALAGGGSLAGAGVFAIGNGTAFSYITN